MNHAPRTEALVGVSGNRSNSKHQGWIGPVGLRWTPILMTPTIFHPGIRLPKNRPVCCQGQACQFFPRFTAGSPGTENRTRQSRQVHSHHRSDSDPSQPATFFKQLWAAGIAPVEIALVRGGHPLLSVNRATFQRPIVLPGHRHDDVAPLPTPPEAAKGFVQKRRAKSAATTEQPQRPQHMDPLRTIPILLQRQLSATGMAAFLPSGSDQAIGLMMAQAGPKGREWALLTPRERAGRAIQLLNSDRRDHKKMCGRTTQADFNFAGQKVANIRPNNLCIRSASERQRRCAIMSDNSLALQFVAYWIKVFAGLADPVRRLRPEQTRPPVRQNT